MTPPDESEWKTRKRRIDPKLDGVGWKLAKRTPGEPQRTEEHDTANGPADYALWLDEHIVGVVEAKKLTLGPQNVLTQAQRYAKGIPASPYNFGGLQCPFLYATNGDPDRAIQDFDQATRLNPNHPLAFTWRAAIYRQKGDVALNRFV